MITMNQQTPLSEKKYIHEPFRAEPLFIISESDTTDEQMKLSSGQLIIPPTAYQCLGTQPSPSAPQLQQQTAQ